VMRGGRLPREREESSEKLVAGLRQLLSTTQILVRLDAAGVPESDFEGLR